MTIDEFVSSMSAEGYDLQVTTTGRVYLANAAPDSAGASTEPGSDWDEECDSILADVAAIAEKYDWSAEWSDDDIVFTSEPSQ